MVGAGGAYPDKPLETDYYIVITERFPLSMAKQEGHKHEDFSDFITKDWLNYDMLGELLYDAEYTRITEKTDMQLPFIRKHHLSKKMC